MERNREPQEDRWTGERLASLNPGEGWRPDVTRGLARLRERRAAARVAPKWPWIAVALLGVSATLMAWPAPRAFAQRCTNACWILLQNLSGGAQPVQEGKLAPDFTLSDASARPVTLSDYRGTVVSLNFWATWCLPCRTEIPWFVEFQQAYGGRGFAVLGVSLDDDGWQSVKPYIESKHVNYPVMTGSEEVAAQFGVASLPVTVLIDASGRIVSTHSGLVSRDTYRREIEVLLERAAARR